jgi:probable HAF family extracellular repeat protein
MQIKRPLLAALLADAILLMAAINSGSSAFAAGGCLPRATHTHHTIITGGCPAPAIPTSYVFTTIDISGAVVPTPFGINDEGVVSGFYSDSSGYYHGFLWHNGTSATIDAPGDWADTYLGGINDAGVAIGNYDDDLTVSHATLFNVRDQRWTRLPDIPGIPLNYGNGINNFGLAVGVAFDGTPTNYYDGVGWIWDGHDYSFIEVPAASGSSLGTYPSAINGEGVVVGLYEDSEGNYHAFLDRDSIITSFDVPGSDGTFGYGINDEGDVVGPYNIAGVPNGFILHEGKFTTVDVPGATSTAIYGINNRGQIVGWYSTTANPNGYGFVATPTDH